MASNFFDQFDETKEGNFFDQFDDSPAQEASRTAFEEARNARLSNDQQFASGTEPERVGLFPQTAGRMARMGAQGLAALPLAAMDAGVGIRNLFEKKPYELPSQTWNKALDSLIPLPEGEIAPRIVEAIGAGVAGSRLPAPQSSLGPTPTNFVDPKQFARQQAMEAGRREGYVTLPSNTNPTLGNRLLEGIGGKLKLQQESSIRNMPKFEATQSRALGLNPDLPITRSTLNNVRSEAFQKGYEPVRSFGRMVADEQYLADLDDITKAATGAGRSFKGLVKNNEMDDVITSLKQSEFDSGDAIDAIRVLRDQADEAYRGGKASLGKSYKSAAKSLEDAVERNLSNSGKNGKALLSAYRSARTQIAKSHTAEKTMGNELGGVDARKMGAELHRGKPLEGGQRVMGEFGRNFPKSSQFISESYPAISPLDGYGAIIASGTTDSLAPLAFPLTRVGVRNYLLSPAGQARGIAASQAPRNTLGGFGSLPYLSNEFMRLLRE